ncbi:MAG TPA: terminase [Spirochaetota bacterium]|nr:terminase [Spirochaetota bacterium]
MKVSVPNTFVVEPDFRMTEKQRHAWNVINDDRWKYFMLYGSSRSGKTAMICYLIRDRARLYEGSKHVVCRFSFANAKKTVWLQTLYPLLRMDEMRGFCRINEVEGVCRYGNGSIIRLGGLEPSSIDSVLAAEYGTIFITEANENKYLSVEMLMSRLNDTAESDTGKPIPLKFLIDLNPTTNNHWSHVLFIRGQDPLTGLPKDNFHEYKAIQFRAEDNEENLAAGYIETLKNLSPAMRKRFYDGEFGAFEGLVYSLDETVHVVEDFDIPSDWTIGAGIDFGYTVPFAVVWGAYDHANDVVYLFREYGDVKTTVRVHAERIKAIENGMRVSWRVADHDAEDRATLAENGVATLPANKEVLAGLDHVIDLMSFTADRGPRIRIFRSCVKLITEMYSYRWRDVTARVSSPKDREVVKEDDHYSDAMRYLIMKFFPDNRPPGVILSRDAAADLAKKKAEEKVSSQSKEFPPGFIGRRR